jgi:hypothetical protein
MQCSGQRMIAKKYYTPGKVGRGPQVAAVKLGDGQVVKLIEK